MPLCRACSVAPTALAALAEGISVSHPSWSTLHPAPQLCAQQCSSDLQLALVAFQAFSWHSLSAHSCQIPTRGSQISRTDCAALNPGRSCPPAFLQSPKIH